MSPFQSTVTSKQPIRVFTEMEIFAQDLGSVKFVVVDRLEDADLRWIVFRALENFRKGYEHQILFNHPEGEGNITIKDTMYENVRSFMAAGGRRCGFARG